MLEIRKDALKQQRAFALSIVIYDSHYSVGPAEDLEKVCSGAEEENSIFSLWRAPTSSVENKKGLFHHWEMLMSPQNINGCEPKAEASTVKIEKLCANFAISPLNLTV